MEADIDCAAAMDILSFALYHENNEVTETPNATKRAAVSDESDIDDDVEDPKRRRLDEEEVPKESSDLHARIWEELSKGQDLTVDDICVDVEDREAVLAALAAMEAEDKLMVMDKIIYQT